MSVMKFAAPLLACAVLLGGCESDPPPTADANTPGYTGRTIVPGNRSTIAGDAKETYRQQKWGMTPRR